MEWFLRYALLRLQARWRGLVTLIIGVVLAALIGATAPLYTTGIAQVGMVQFLDGQPSQEINVYSRTSLSPAASENFSGEWGRFDGQHEAVFSAAFRNLSAWTGEPIHFAETQPLVPVVDGEDIERADVTLAYYGGIADHTRLVAGAWPAESPEGVAAEVAISAATAEALELEAGTILTLEQRGWESSQPFVVRVSGVIEAVDAEAPYWFAPSPLRLEISGRNIDAMFLTTRTAMEEIPAQYLPEPIVQIGWRVALDHRQLPFSQIDAAQNALADYDDTLSRAFLSSSDEQGNLVILTNLPVLLSEYAEQVVFLNIPFGLLLVQLGALVLFFLVLIAALVRRSERREIAMLQSRGATDGQILWARSIEAAVIVLFAAGIAPLMAQAALGWFIPIFMGIEQVPLELTATVFAFSAGVAGLAFVFLLMTLFPVLRQPLIAAGGAGSRSQAQTWWQRYYLDVVLLIVGSAALFQLTRTQSAVATSAEGNVQADPLLLLAPTLLFVAFSSVLLRFFPGLMNVIAAFFSRRKGVEGALASWQVSREPLHYGRIAFLLALAIGIGWFAVSYQATLAGNQRDQAEYFVGGDVRLVFNEGADTGMIEERIAAVQELDGVQDSIAVARIELPSVATGSGRRSRQAGDLLALDSERLADVIDWRGDLGRLDVPDNGMIVPDMAGERLPEGTQTVTFRAYLEAEVSFAFSVPPTDFRPYPFPLLEDGVFTAGLTTGTGQSVRQGAETQADALQAYIDAVSADEDRTGFAPVDTDNDSTPDTLPDFDFPDGGWVVFVVDVAELDAPITLNGITLAIGQNRSLVNVHLLIADFAAVDAEGNITALDRVMAEWDVVRGVNANGPTTVTISEDGEALSFRWGVSDDFNSPGVRANLLLNTPEIATVSVSGARSRGGAMDEAPDENEIVGLPALASASFMALNEFEEGQRFDLVIDNVSPWFEVAGVNEYYPTLYAERPYIVTDYATLDYTMRRTTGTGITHNEVWFDLEVGVDQGAFVDALREVIGEEMIEAIYSAEATLDGYQTDVLAQGVIGLLFISFMVGLALSVVSLFTYISLTVQSRLAEFAVLRALGLTTGRMIVSIVIEQGLVLLGAILLGAVIGQFLTAQILPPLALSAAGGSVTPPLVLRLDAGALARYLLVIVGMLGIVLAASAYRVQRTATADALRLVEE